MNIYLGRSFPSVIEALHKVESGQDKTWDNVNIQLAIVTHHIQMGSKILGELGT